LRLVASAPFGVALVVAALVLSQKNRSRLTGRGIHPHLLERMRGVVAAQPEVVVGPATLIVDGDVTLDRELRVPDVEAVIDRVSAKLRSHWPQVAYVYLTPVAARRPRGAHRAAAERPAEPPHSLAPHQ
jgi:divalent metal cation (Fe/Co/Zn/Cd) transporter